MLPRRHTNATKAHPILPLRQHHGGVSQPLVVDLGGGLQTLTNFSEGNHKVRFLSEWLLPPRSLQPPRVIRTLGRSSKLAQIMNSFGAKKGNEWIYHLIGELLSNAPRTLGNLGFGVGEWEREWRVFLASSKWMVNLIPWKGKVYIYSRCGKVTVWDT